MGQSGVSLGIPCPFSGPGGMFLGNSHFAPVRGSPRLIPWMGPRLSPLNFNRDPSGALVGRGPNFRPGLLQGQETPQITPRPGPPGGAGPQKVLRAHVFWGPGGPIMHCMKKYKEAQEERCIA